MSDALLAPLLRAVRRRLQAEAAASALRRAAGLGAALALLAAAWHRAVAPLPGAVLLVPLLLPWFAAVLAWVWRRPDAHACARFADRQLGGASAYGTWLDAPASAPAGARQHLQRWVAARLPASLQALAAQPRPAVGGRPLAVLALCSVLAGFVLLRPGAPATAHAPVAVAPAGTAASASGVAAATPDLAGELERALRPDAAGAEPRRSGSASPAPTGREARATDAPDDTRSGAAPRAAAAIPAATAATPGAAPPAVAASATGVAAAGATGREAGDSRDAAPGRTPGVTSRTASARADTPSARSGESIADPGRRGGPAAFDTAATATSPALPPAAPARPPAAADAPLLTPAQARYLEAWRQAQR